MQVALTGAVGFIGSHILTELQKHGHEVTALVRDEAQADAARSRGADDCRPRQPRRGDHHARLQTHYFDS